MRGFLIHPLVLEASRFRISGLLSRFGQQLLVSFSHSILDLLVNLLFGRIYLQPMYRVSKKKFPLSIRTMSIFFKNIISPFLYHYLLKVWCAVIQKSLCQKLDVFHGFGDNLCNCSRKHVHEARQFQMQEFKETRRHQRKMQ